MGWFSDALEGAVDFVGDIGEAAIKDPVTTLLTGGLNTQVEAGKKAYESYQYRNKGRTAENRAKQMEQAAAAQAQKDAAAKLAGESMLASVPYSSAFGSPQQTMLSPQSGRKSILGSF